MFESLELLKHSKSGTPHLTLRYNSISGTKAMSDQKLSIQNDNVSVPADYIDDEGNVLQHSLSLKYGHLVHFSDST